MDKKRVGKHADCNRCAYYYITHDARFSYGCRALDFKSKRLPCREVEEASGQPCQFFQQKAKLRA